MRETPVGTLGPENTRSRLTVQISSSAALVAFVSPGQPGQTAANSYDTASAPPVAGDDPVNASDPTGDSARNGGRIQIQRGSEYVVPSQNWSQPNPPTVSDGLNMMATLKTQVMDRNKKIWGYIEVPFSKVQNKIDQCGMNSEGCPVLSMASQGKNNYHVDLEIQTGRAFVPDPLAGGTGTTCAGGGGPGPSVASICTEIGIPPWLASSTSPCPQTGVSVSTPPELA